MRAPLLGPMYLPKALPPNTISIGVRDSTHVISGVEAGTNVQSIRGGKNLFHKSNKSTMLCYAKSLQSCPTLCEPTRLRRPWDSPGKNTGVDCHFLLQCMKEKSESEVAQSCPTLSDPMDCSLPGSSVHWFSRQEYWSGVPLPSLNKSTRKK